MIEAQNAVQREAALVRKAQEGDMDAFEALVNEHSTYVYNLALRIVQNSQEAEDLAQEAFVRVWKAIPKYRAKAQFRTWLYRIVTNVCYDRLPKLKRELNTIEPDQLLELPDTQPSLENEVLSIEEKKILHQRIDTLPESYRLLITLRHLQELSYTEIAEVTNQPLGTVKTGIYRARNMLKERLVPYEN